jgi:threonine dehydrogenase-like Zn-dependent dehydrogenase
VSGSSSTAAVLVDKGRIELEEFPLPKIGTDEGLLRVEACGLCGTDVEVYDGAFTAMGLPFGIIPGHEPVGIIEEIGANAARRWGVSQGSRVVVEPLIGCGYCRSCLTGNYRMCRTGRPGTPVAGYSFIPTTVPPALWGAYSQYMYLDPHTVLHEVSSDLTPELAALYQPVAAGIRWAGHEAGTRIGDTVVILGPGQRGLGCVIAAREAGAHNIIVTGLASDAHKLELAIEFGAHHTIVADQEDTIERVKEYTGGEGADVVVDVTPLALAPVVHAVQVAKAGGTIMLAGMKGSGRTIPGFSSDAVMLKELTIKGMNGQDLVAVEPALRLIESRRYPLEKMHTHTFALPDAERAVQTLAGRVSGEQAISLTIAPQA